MTFVIVACLLGLWAAPARGDQYQDAKIIASDSAAKDEYGSGVAVSDDMALIGAKHDDDKGDDSGSAYVLRHDPASGSWTEEAKLLPADGTAGDSFGFSAALCGHVALIGAPWDDTDWEDAGSVYVFRYDPGTGSWNEEAKLVPSDGGWEDAFGFSIALSGDVALIGTPYYYDNQMDTGSTYVFRYDPGSGTWTEEANLIPSDGAGGEFFGTSVALSGTRALIGAPFDDDNGYWSGSAYLFEYDAGSSTWLETGKLLAHDGAVSDRFGQSVALGEETALIGSAGDDDKGTGSGSAYVFQYDSSSGTWIEEQKLSPADGAANHAFGGSVALSDGKAVLTALGDNYEGAYTGSAYLFGYDPLSDSWIEEDKLLASDSRRWKRFGTSAALAGKIALIAAQFDHETGYASGSVYAFDITPYPPQLDIKVDGDDGPLTIPSTQTVSITVSLDPGDQKVEHDWWVAGFHNSSDLYCWHPAVGWQYCPIWAPLRTYNGVLFEINDFLISQSPIPIGSWNFVFAIDERNHQYEGTYLDSVQVISQ